MEVERVVRGEEDNRTHTIQDIKLKGRFKMGKEEGWRGYRRVGAEMSMDRVNCVCTHACVCVYMCVSACMCVCLCMCMHVTQYLV